jgi:hypothetical protein
VGGFRDFIHHFVESLIWTSKDDLLNIFYFKLEEILDFLNISSG